MQGQPRRQLPADGHHAVPHAAAASEDRPDAEADPDPLRGELRPALHLYRRPQLPPHGEPQPWWYGYSVGRWEGDTLVVETNNLRGAEDGPFDGWLDVRGSPYSEQAKFTERFRRPIFGKLEIDVTVEDPKSYTKPFTVRINQRMLVDEEPIEFICNENQQFRRRIKIG